ncbi:MAG: 1,4-dihydroxy-6-naphthoate synthase [Alistipes sp.]|nr:1,4-dihydroxy-6-naphthoate synthase [Alistipes sp.]
MKLKLNISTCPNDTFMFDALVHGRIDTEGLAFDLHLADIEELNQAALHGEPDLTKLSYAVMPQLLGHYKILHSGSALGRGNGPLLVSRHRLYPDELHDATVAIPGEHTTANRLLSLLYPQVQRKRVYLFSDIAEAILSEECDAGVLIHEGRFTYREKGLQQVVDLGCEWERQTGLPLPLGAIAVSTRLDLAVQQQVDRVVRRSVEYAFAHPEASADFVRHYAQEMSEEVTRRHIDLFVNPYSIDLGAEGKEAVCRLLTCNEEVFV